MILTTPGLQQSIENGWPVVAMAAITLPVPEVLAVWPDGIMRLWDGVGELDYDGYPWRGLGIFGRMTGIGGSKRLTLRAVTFQLSGIPADYSVFLSPELRNKAAKAWVAGMDARGIRINGEPFLEVDGLCDYQTLETEEGGSQVIKLIVREPVYSIERAQTLKHTAEYWNKRLESWRNANLGGARITGYDKIPELADATRSWTRT